MNLNLISFDPNSMEHSSLPLRKLCVFYYLIGERYTHEASNVLKSNVISFDPHMQIFAIVKFLEEII